jgi:iron complex outermembrane receptor protein
MHSSVIAAAMVFCSTLSSLMAAGVTVSGTVTVPGGAAAKDTRIVLVELNKSLFVDDDGTFRFDAVPPGFYHVQAISRRFGTQVAEVTVASDDVRLTIELGRLEHHETIVVTAGSTRGAAEIIQPANVLERSDISEAMQPTIGETLKGEPGLNSTQYGAGSSRPVIRGQGGGRIRILEEGLDIGDASVSSPDHAVAIDPLSTDRVEIIRGPATLLYGNTAVGGVVNMMDERILDHVPQSKVGGTVELRAGSVADERSAAAELRGGAGRVAWYANGFRRETDDYSIPGQAFAFEDPDSPEGTLPNSAVENAGATLGLSWVGSTGYVGASARLFDSLYGIPVEIHGHEEDPPVPAARRVAAQEQAANGGVRVDMRHLRYDVRGGFDTRIGPFSGIEFRVGATDYEHAELEGSEVGTRFFTDTVDGRLEMRHGTAGKLRGSAGLQFGRRKLEAVGAEAFLPESTTDALALFAVEEIEGGPMIYQFGLRLQRQETTAEPRPDAEPPEPKQQRDFSGGSASLGLVWRSGEAYAIGASLARTERFPRAEELFSDGPHLATLSYERGDPDLDPETSLGFDLSFRKLSGKVNGELTFFVNRYDDYIFEFPTGELVDELPVFQFVQADAEFAGAEMNLLVELWESSGNHLGLEFISDFVRAELTASGEPLPYIPPWRFGSAIHYRGARWHASIDLWYYDEQTRVPGFDLTDVAPELRGLYGLTPTDSYTMVNAHVGYRLPIGGTKGLMHEFLLRLTNLTDEEARNSVSRLKDFVPLPGRDVGLAYRLIF